MELPLPISPELQDEFQENARRFTWQSCVPSPIAFSLVFHLMAKKCSGPKLIYTDEQQAWLDSAVEEYAQRVQQSRDSAWERDWKKAKVKTFLTQFQETLSGDSEGRDVGSSEGKVNWEKVSLFHGLLTFSDCSPTSASMTI